MTDLDRFEFKHLHDRRPDLLLQTVNLEAVALEHHLGPCRVRDSLEDRLHLRRIERRGRHENVK